MLPKAGLITVWGLTFQEVRDVIAQEVQQYYAGVQVSVAMARTRTMPVYVFGEVGTPGMHNLSSLSHVMHGLIAAGGIKPSGSLRNVQIIRQGETAITIDLYDLLLKGDLPTELRLQNDDIIFVPPIGPVAGIAGEVRRPAIYELADGETLLDLVKLAGGVARSADTTGIRIARFSAYRRR